MESREREREREISAIAITDHRCFMLGVAIKRAQLARPAWMSPLRMAMFSDNAQ